MKNNLTQKRLYCNKSMYNDNRNQYCMFAPVYLTSCLYVRVLYLLRRPCNLKLKQMEEDDAWFRQPLFPSCPSSLSWDFNQILRI